MAATPFERCGGAQGLSRLVMALYDRVLATDRLQAYFAETDMRRLVDHHAKFLGALMGGPSRYDDGVLGDVHAGLGVSDADFDAMLAALRETLAETALAPEDVAEVVSRYETYRSVVVRAGR